MNKRLWLGLAATGVVIIIAITVSLLHEDKNVKEGHKLFSYYCLSCHGGKGRGDGINAKNLDPLPRDLTDSKEEYMGKLNNDHIFKVISGGGKAIDKSQNMPPYGNTLSEKEIWSIVAFVRTLHSYKGEKVDFNQGMKTERPKFSVKKIDFNDVLTEEDMERKEIASGKKIYKKSGCSACHKIEDKGGEVGPELTNVGFRLNKDWIYHFIMNPNNIIRGVKMPNFGLNEEAGFSITLYLSSLKKETG